MHKRLIILIYLLMASAGAAWGGVEDLSSPAGGRLAGFGWGGLALAAGLALTGGRGFAGPRDPAGSGRRWGMPSCAR